MKEESDEVGFRHAEKHENFLQIDKKQKAVKV